MAPRRLPTSASARLGRLDRARRVADVLAHVAEPLARGQRDVAVGIAGELLERGGNAGGIRRVVTVEVRRRLVSFRATASNRS